eukprot:4198972-Pyramimonas_sp.AAC.1
MSAEVLARLNGRTLGDLYAMTLLQGFQKPRRRPKWAPRLPTVHPRRLKTDPEGISGALYSPRLDVAGGRGRRRGGEWFPGGEGE